MQLLDAIPWLAFALSLMSAIMCWAHARMTMAKYRRELDVANRVIRYQSQALADLKNEIAALKAKK